MSTTPSSIRPNLEFYRKQAKALLKAARAGDADAAERLGRYVPRLAASTGPLPSDVALHDAQLAVARENGFGSWPIFQAHVLAESGAASRRFRPHVRGFKWYEDRVAGVVSMHKSGSADAIEIIRQHHPRFRQLSDDEIRAADFKTVDAEVVLAGEHGFASWEKFKTHVEEINSGKITEPFTAAFDAIQSGDVAGFQKLLEQHADLVDAQGTNGSSLLNLSVSLKQPAICRLLIDFGAEVDLATTRGVTPLHQAAYSNQAELVEMLIDAGASPQGYAYGDGGTPLAMALFWGHDAARVALARYAIVPNNLRTAAGIGRFDLVNKCFVGGELTADAIAHRGFYRPHTGFPVWSPTDDRHEVLDEALVYAARNGQLNVLEFLLQMGADIDGDPYRGTALVWAVVQGRMEVINWLLDHGADINHRGTFGGLTHGKGYTALHAAAETGQLEIVKLLVQRGADPKIRDLAYDGPALNWAKHHNHPAIVEYLQSLP